MLNPTVHANCKFLYCAKILKPLIAANDSPTITAILISFHKILNTSFTSSSSVARPLIINVELCEPQLPPVSISIGKNATNKGTAANAFSYFVMIVPVIADESINISNHTILFFACLNTDVSK